MQKAYRENPPTTYTEFEKIIKETMEKTLDKITIKIGQYRPKMSDKAKSLKMNKKNARKAFEKATELEKKNETDRVHRRAKATKR